MHRLEDGGGAAHRNCKDKEKQSIDNDHERLHIRTLKADNKGQNDDADHVVDDGGAQNGGTDPALQPAHFTKRLHSNADGGGRHNDADKHRFKEIIRSHGRKAVHARIQKIAAQKRNQNARAGNKEGRDARFFQILQIRLQAGDKHQHNDADFRHLIEKLTLVYNSQYRGADQQTGNNLADDLRHMDPASQNTQRLRCDNNNRKIKKETN